MTASRPGVPGVSGVVHPRFTRDARSSVSVGTAAKSPETPETPEHSNGKGKSSLPASMPHSRCHPPAHEALVLEWIDLSASEGAAR